MKAKSKYLYIPIAIIMFAVIGFLVREGTHEQSASDVIWGIYSPILMTLGIIVAIVIIFWIVKQSAKLGNVNEANQVVGILGRIFSLIGSLIPIILGWLLFVASIMFLHPHMWSLLYGKGEWGLPIFWIAQAIFVLLLFASYKHLPIFYLILTVLTVMSFWNGFSDKIKRDSFNGQGNTIVYSPTLKNWEIGWRATNGKSGTYNASVVQIDDNKLIIWQYDPKRPGNKAIYKGRKTFPGEYCGVWVQRKPRKKVGNFCLKFNRNLTYATGWTKDQKTKNKNPQEEDLWIKIKAVQ